MSDEYEPPVEPFECEDETKFAEYVEELVSKHEEYNELKKRTDRLNATVKEYMIKNNLDIYTVKSGKVAMLKQKRNVLNRTLIKNIQQYYEKKIVMLLYKSPN